MIRRTGSSQGYGDDCCIRDVGRSRRNAVSATATAAEHADTVAIKAGINPSGELL